MKGTPFAALFPYLSEIEEEMRVLLAQRDPSLGLFYGPMGYHLGWVDREFRPVEAHPGKRIRPLLCLLVREAISGDYGVALPAAAAVELLHNFSLIHDDIEDGSPIRRGRATVWRLWGQPQAINIGDGLLVLSHLALQRLAERGVDPQTISRALQILDEACLALCEGQHLDLLFQQRTDLSVEEYLDMASRKTASLLECAAHLGALLACGDERVTESYRRFARNLGIGFQITDDILGIWGEEEETGKGVGEDIEVGKRTLPLVYALQEEKRRGQTRLRDIYDREPVDLEAVLSILNELGAKGYCQELAQRFSREALEELERTGIENQAQGHLKALALFLTERRY